jgi:hypothetical protein
MLTFKNESAPWTLDLPFEARVDHSLLYFLWMTSNTSCLLTILSRRGRVRKDNRKMEAKRKLWRKSRVLFMGWGRNSVLLEGFQAVPARLFNNDTMRVKMLGS